MGCQTYFLIDALLTTVLCEDVAPDPLFGRPEPLDPGSLSLAHSAGHGRLAPGERGAGGERAPAPWPPSCRLLPLLRPHHS